MGKRIRSSLGEPCSLAMKPQQTFHERRRWANDVRGEWPCYLATDQSAAARGEVLKPQRHAPPVTRSKGKTAGRLTVIGDDLAGNKIYTVMPKGGLIF